MIHVFVDARLKRCSPNDKSHVSCGWNRATWDDLSVIAVPHQSPQKKKNKACFAGPAEIDLQNQDGKNPSGRGVQDARRMLIMSLQVREPGASGLEGR